MTILRLKGAPCKLIGARYNLSGNSVRNTTMRLIRRRMCPVIRAEYSYDLKFSSLTHDTKQLLIKELTE